MDENKFKGKLLGNLGEVFGTNSTIEIDETDCWLNFSRNVTLTINGGKNYILCSNNLSDLIREKKLDENTEELKKFAVYEFEEGKKYVTYLIENIAHENDSFQRNRVKLDRFKFAEEYLKLVEEHKSFISKKPRTEDFLKADKIFKEKEKNYLAELEKIDKLSEEL